MRPGLAASGKLSGSDEAVELLKKLVEELAAIRKELQALNSKPATSPAPPPTAAVQRAVFSGYFQPVFNNTDQRALGIPNDAFQFRNVRTNMIADIDARTQARISIEYATSAKERGLKVKVVF